MQTVRYWRSVDAITKTNSTVSCHISFLLVLSLTKRANTLISITWDGKTLSSWSYARTNERPTIAARRGCIAVLLRCRWQQIRDHQSGPESGLVDVESVVVSEVCGAVYATQAAYTH
eukprot:CAMPEP_0116571142 /NCGR_PEP_ID=MMETSP0397-20121206/17385_1 /TAXON_ID=216820 /ORGANISM="Cyclophora tenuis, Strain ECT3854" /LENGTH=116 /DNA_ID=CAMNT_0004099185 /DNA_START=479 /DNA_END=827 /DNA_ORIENTATION=+